MRSRAFALLVVIMISASSFAQEKKPGDEPKAAAAASTTAPAPVAPEPAVIQAQAPIAVVPPQPAAPTEAPAEAKSFPYELSTEQINVLQSSSCRFDSEDRLVADNLKRRGFTADEFVQAYKSFYMFRLQHRTDIEALAVFQYLGIPERDFSRIKWRESEPVTSYYDKRIGGVSMVIWGWIFFGAGASALIPSMVLLGLSQSSSYCQDQYDQEQKDGTANGYSSPQDCKSSMGVASIVTGAVSVVALGVGIPLLAVGYHRIHKHARNGILDNGTKDEMAPYRLDAPNGGDDALIESGLAEATPDLELRLTGIATGQGSQLALQLRF